MKTTYRFCGKCNRYHKNMGNLTRKHASSMTPYYTQHLRNKEGRQAAQDFIKSL
jgi:hypothetical protein